jgi:hypothetical protein
MTTNNTSDDSDMERVKEIREQYARADSHRRKRLLEYELLWTVCWSDMEVDEIQRQLGRLSSEDRRRLHNETKDKRLAMELRRRYFSQVE